MNTPLHRGISTDYDVPAGQPGRYVLTEEYRDGYVVLARFKKLADAKRYLENMDRASCIEQAAKRIAQLELQLHIADYGMGMPRDYQNVLALRVALEEAIKDHASTLIAEKELPWWEEEWTS